MIQIDVDTAPVMSELLSFEERARDMTEPMTAIGEMMVDSVHQNFDQEGRPIPWQPRLDDNPWPILYHTGALYNSIEATATSNSVTVDAGVEYGVYHDEGTAFLPQRQFLIIQPEDQAAIDEILFNYFA